MKKLYFIAVLLLLCGLNWASGDQKTPSKASQKPTDLQVWGIGLISVTVISLCAAVGIALIPTLNERLYQRLLTYFVGLGVGSLCGSAIFHLIPHTFHLDEEGTRAFLANCWVLVGGIFLFFIVDKALKIYMVYRKNKMEGARVGAAEMHSTPQVEICNGLGLQGCSDTCSIPEHKHVVFDQAFAKQAHALCTHDHDVQLQESAGGSVIKTVAWMIIFGDGLHNFVDGLSIGAAFATSIVSGISVSVAILCEEFPHELGDVAILVNSGMKLKQALVCNLLSASTCFVGFVVGVFLGELEEASVYIFALAGGMFLYISLASMVPEMNESMEGKLNTSLSGGIKVMLLQTTGVATGLVALFLLAYFESEIHF